MFTPNAERLKSQRSWEFSQKLALTCTDYHQQFHDISCLHTAYPPSSCLQSMFREVRHGPTFIWHRQLSCVSPRSSIAPSFSSFLNCLNSLCKMCFCFSVSQFCSPFLFPLLVRPSWYFTLSDKKLQSTSQLPHALTQNLKHVGRR